uniref:Uncharacterized protein n=1 Tax=Microcebus murinus TaxID=30608 RepID=A0A8C5XTH8_MICMU
MTNDVEHFLCASCPFFLCEVTIQIFCLFKKLRAGEIAASGESGTSGGGGSTEDAFMTFYSEVLQKYKHKAFEAVDKAYKLLLDQEQKKRALDVIQAGKEYVEHTVKERKKQLKKEGKPTIVEEDDPELFKQAVYEQTMKLFAELEIKRKEKEAKAMHEGNDKGKKRLKLKNKPNEEREWQKNFEESRDGSCGSWRNFQANTKGKKEKKNRTFLRPPKVKMEQRE